MARYLLAVQEAGIFLSLSLGHWLFVAKFGLFSPQVQRPPGEAGGTRTALWVCLVPAVCLRVMLGRSKLQFSVK